jgi:Right handed beta helix region
MFRALGCTALCTAAVLAALALAPGLARADHVSCGDVITEDTTLDSDVSCHGESAPVALTIGADGVRLDLGGHAVGADITICGSGVLNQGHDRVTITNGRVGAPGCGIAIVVSGADHNRFLDLVAGGDGGIWLRGSDHNRIARSELGADAVGALLLEDGSDGNVITRNAFGDACLDGFYIFDSDDNLVSRNVHQGGDCGDANIVGAGADDTTVRRNDFQGGGIGDALHVRSETTGTLLVRNEVRGYAGDGIQVDSPSTTLTRNSSNDNGGWGILAVPGVIDGGGNTASGNLLGQCLNVSC